jgi:hypothetical protein
MVDKNKPPSPNGWDSGPSALLGESNTQVLSELLTQQLRMQKLLEEMHALQINQAKQTAGIVEEAVRTSFAQHASKAEYACLPKEVPHKSSADVEYADVSLPDVPEPPQQNAAFSKKKSNPDMITTRSCWDEDSTDKRDPAESLMGQKNSRPSQASIALPDRQSQKQLWNATKLARKASLSEMSAPKHPIAVSLRKMIESNQFDYFVGAVILLNSIFIAAQTDLAAKELSEPTGSTATLFRTCDVIFTLFFSAELLLRVIVEKMRFLTGRNKYWNFFDTVVVATAIIEESMSLVSNTRVLRLLRVMRLVRLARFIRVMRVFRELRAMVWGIMHSIMSLIWAVILLVVIMFLFACYVTQAVTHELMNEQDALRHLTDDDMFVLRNSYGSLMRTMYSLYQAITGGMDWSYFADPLFKISSLLGSLFCFYIAFAVFAVLNVVTGVFVDNAMKSTELDTDLMIVEENAARVRNVEGLRGVFHKADVDGSGTIEWDEFLVHMGDPVVQAYFRQLGLDIEGPGVQGLWDLLDFDGNGTLNIDEMVWGAARLKGLASSLDLARESYNQRQQTQVQFEAIRDMFQDVRKFQNQNTGVLLRDIRKFMSNMGYYGPSHPEPPLTHFEDPVPPKTPQGSHFIRTGDHGFDPPGANLPPVPSNGIV